MIFQNGAFFLLCFIQIFLVDGSGWSKVKFSMKVEYVKWSTVSLLCSMANSTVHIWILLFTLNKIEILYLMISCLFCCPVRIYMGKIHYLCRSADKCIGFALMCQTCARCVDVLGLFLSQRVAPIWDGKMRELPGV